MKNFNTTTFGWRYVQQKESAVIKKKSLLDFLISIIMAFLIILILSQVLAQLDKAIRLPFGGKVTELNLFSVLQAQAATAEAVKLIQSEPQSTLTLIKGQKLDFTVGYKNAGQKTWLATGSGNVELRRKDSNGLAFKAKLATAKNKPGEIGYYTMTLVAPTAAGSYKYTYLLARNGKEVINGSEFQLTIKVVDSLKASQATTKAPASANLNQAALASSVSNLTEAVMTTTNNTLQMVKGEKNNHTVSFKNAGQRFWKQAGSDKVELKRKDTYGLTFKASLASATTKPGSTGSSTMTLNAPTSAGTYTFTYLLVRNGKEVVSGSQFDLVIKVVNTSQEKAQAQVAVPNQPATPVMAKQEFVAPSNLMEICVSLKKGNYKTATIAPGFLDGCLKIGINLTTEIAAPVVPPPPPANNLQPSVTPPSVNPNPQTGNGPIVRIGLYHTTDSIVISANGSFTIKDQNQSILAKVNGFNQSIVTYSSGTYTLNVNGTSLATSSYLRFVPDNQATVMEIVSLNQRPAWNTNLNDNRFLGTLEVRYATSTSRLWVINELEMENYLKGLAESSNGSPMEYQKALLTAARSYAMYHYNRGTKHAAENFTLDATYDQVYRGYNSQSRMWQVSDAVEQTKGQVVTYNGQVVVTPYFSYSDGRTRNWQEVWGGAGVPWCVSVKEPAGYDKTTMYGHGVGMSARGAILLAGQYNYTFEQILKYYYTGVAIQKIY